MHRLVLSGIGGGTVGAAGAALSAAELSAWVRFERQYGPIDIGSRVDYWGALLCSLLVNVNGGWKGGEKAKPADFMPRREPLEEDAPQANIAAIAAALGATYRKA